MGRNLSKDMYLRGTIETFAGMPQLADRSEGMVWQIDNDDAIDDAYGTIARKVAVPFLEDDPVAGVIGVIGTTLLTFIADQDVLAGSIVIIGKEPAVGEVDTTTKYRVISTATSGTLVTLDRPLEAGIALDDASDTDEISVVMSVVSLFVSDEDSHEIERNPDYAKVTGTDSKFTGDVAVGDIIVFNPTASINIKREVISITSDTEMYMNEEFTVGVMSGKDFYILGENGEQTLLRGTCAVAGWSSEPKANPDYAKLTIPDSAVLNPGAEIQLYYHSDTIDSVDVWSIKNRIVTSVGTGFIIVNKPLDTPILPLTATKSNYIEQTAQTIIAGTKFYVWMDGAFVAMS